MDAFSPRSLEEALEVRAAHPEAVPVAGGTDLMGGGERAPAAAPLAPGSLARRGAEALRARRHRLPGGRDDLRARSPTELGEFGPLVAAARSVASPQIRNRATIGGNLATASPAGDSIPVLRRLRCGRRRGGERAGGRGGSRSASSSSGPKRTSLAPDELIVGVEWTPVPGPGSFAKVGRRNAMIIALASVCLQLDEETGCVRLALGSVGPTVLRAPRAEELAREALD